MPDRISYGKFKPNTEFSDKVIENVKKQMADEEIVIPFKTKSQQRAEDRQNEIGVEFGLDETKKYFKNNIDSDGDGKLSTIDELNKLSEYSVKPRMVGKEFTAKAKAYIDGLYNSAQVSVTDDNSVQALHKKYKNEVSSKNINEITSLIDRLCRIDPAKHNDAIRYLTNLRDAYWMKHAPEPEEARRIIAEGNLDDLSYIKVKD